MTRDGFDNTWPKPLSRAAYHGIVGNVVDLIAPQCEADPANLLITTLIMFGNWIGRRAYMNVGRAKHYTNEYGVIVGKTGSGGRKGTGKEEVQEFYRQCDRMSRSRWIRRVKGGMSSGEGLIAQFIDPPPTEDKPEPSPADKRLMVFETEFSRTLRVMNRPDNILSEVLRQGWETGDLRTMTKNPVEVRGAHLSIIGHITPSELKRHLGETERANGFGNRFLFALSKRSKVLPLPNVADMSSLIDDMANAQEFARKPRSITWDDTVIDFWKEQYVDLTRPPLGIAGELLSRGEAHVMRLAMIYALLDCSETIKRPHLRAAIEVWRYCSDSVRYLYGNAIGDPIADPIWEAVKRSKRGVTQTDMYRLFSNNKDRDDIHRALEMLDSEYGLIKCTTRNGRDVWVSSNS